MNDPLANNSSSSQQWIIQAMHSMKEQDDERILYGNAIAGMCYGYAAMFMLAFLQEERNDDGHLKGFVWFNQLIKRLGVIAPDALSEHMALLYRKRLDIIQQVMAENPSLNDLERQVRIHHALEQHLTHDELLDLDLPALFDGIELFQHSSQHDELHQRQIKSQVMEPLLPLLAFDCHQKLDGIDFVMDFLGVFIEKKVGNKNELSLYLSLLRQAISDLRYPITMQLISNGHAIAIAFDPQKNYWAYSDVNRGVNNIIITDEDSELARLIQDSFYKSAIYQLDELPIEKDIYQNQYLLVNQTLYYVDQTNHLIKLIPKKGNEDYLAAKLVSLQQIMGDNKRSALSFDTMSDIKSHCRAYSDFSFIINMSFYVNAINHQSLLCCLRKLKRQAKCAAIIELTDEKCLVKNANGKTVSQLVRPHDVDNAQFRLGKANLLNEFMQQVHHLKNRKTGFFAIKKEYNLLQIDFLETVLSEYSLINGDNTNQQLRDANLQKAIISCYACFALDCKPVVNIIADKSSTTAVLIQKALPTGTEIYRINRLIAEYKEDFQRIRKRINQLQKETLSSDLSLDSLKQGELDYLKGIMQEAIKLLSCDNLSATSELDFDGILRKS